MSPTHASRMPFASRVPFIAVLSAAFTVLACTPAAFAQTYFWSGASNNTWDINTTTNWISSFTGPSIWTNGAVTVFDDSATGSTFVNVSTTVLPASLTVSNSVKPYTLAGSGGIAGTRLVKTGTGLLTVTSTNAFSNGNSDIQNGTVAFTGGPNSVTGELWIGSTPAAGAGLVVSNSTLNVSSWLALGRGNGTNNHVSSVTLHNSTVNVGYLSTGFAAGIPGNQAVQNLNLNSSTLASVGQIYTSESIGSVSTATVAGASSMSVKFGWTSIALRGNSTAVFQDNSTCDFKGDFNITDLGNGTQASLTVKNNAQLTVGNQNWNTGAGWPGDFYIGKAANSVCTLNIEDNANLYCRGRAIFATGAGSLVTVNMTGGTFTMVGENGGYHNNLADTGTVNWNQSGGTVTIWRDSDWAVKAGSSWNALISGGNYIQGETWSFLRLGESGSATLTLTNLGTVQCNGQLQLGLNSGGAGQVHLNGGTLIANSVFGGAGSSVFNFNGGLLRAGPAAKTNFLYGLNTAVVRSGGARIDDSGFYLTLPQPLVRTSPGDGGLIKTGAGTLALNGTNTYTNTTIVAEGTLAGTGIIAGPVQVNATARLSAGLGNADGLLTLQESPTLNGTVVARIKNNGGVFSANVLKLLAPLTYAGNLHIVNMGTNVLHPGETFTLFDAPAISGNFTSLTTTSPGQVVTWNVNSPAPGQFTVASAISTNSPQLTGTATSSNLTLTWPSEHLGWRLLVQTNSLENGLNGNWFTWPGSTNTTSVSIPIETTNPSVFFRLVFP